MDKDNAMVVARHLVAAERLALDDPEQALEHARAARARASRIAIVREAVGVLAYRNAQWSEALSELRAAHRMGGDASLLPLMADCERALGRPERAIELARSERAKDLDEDASVELRIVESGARLDLGDIPAALATLRGGDLDPARRGAAAARLFYAYAETLLTSGDAPEALIWFQHAQEADEGEETDAAERVAELTP
ncbi:hypothetical protein [Segniliparus rotundus]|uniref:hypothetical protein n=1 Tax=Segniliparus rotundus TaxID=286802 RepID=UPI0002FF64EC|nr:hypothetical protein [Segniliparus rotundus]